MTAPVRLAPVPSPPPDTTGAVGGRPLAPATTRLLLLTAALLPIKFGSGGPLAPADVTILLAGATLLPRLPRFPRAARVPCWALLGALTASGFVTFFGSDAYAARWGIVRLVGLVLLLAYLATFHHAFARQPALVLRSLRVFVTSTLVVNVALLPGMPTRPLLAVLFHQKWDSRLSGALYDPNANGAVLATCLVLVLFGPRQLIRGRGWRTLAALALAACLAWTFSRGAAAGAAVGIAYGAAGVLRRRPHQLLAILLGLGVVAAVVVASGLPQVVEQRYEDRPQSSLDNRVGYVESSIDAFLEHPVTGAGLGHGTSSAGAVTHATFFWLLGDAGIVAAAAYGWLLLAAVQAARRSASALSPALIGCLLCIALTSFSFESLYQRPLWLVLAVAFSAASVLPARPPAPARSC